MTMMTERPAAPAAGVYLPTDVSPETLFQAIGRLRREAQKEVDRLLAFLDSLEDCDCDNAIDDEPCDEDSDPEPSLGAFDRMTDQSKAWRRAESASLDVDAEHDDCDREDSDPAEDADPHGGGDDTDNGIGDMDGLLEQAPMASWQQGGAL